MTSGVGVESVVVEEWIESVLRNDVALASVVDNRFFQGVAPKGTEYPFVTYNQQDATDLVVVGHARVWTDTLYLVRVVAKADRPTPKMITAAAAIDAALTTKVGAPVAEPTGTVLTAVRDRPHRMRSTEEGHTYSFLGGIYRIYAQGS